MRNYLVVFMLFTTILFASKQELTVTILPQKYFVEKIVKDKFDINVMVNQVVLLTILSQKHLK